MIVCCAWHLLNLSQGEARKEEMLSEFAAAKSYKAEKSGRERLSRIFMKTIRRKSQGEEKVYWRAKGIVDKTCLKLFLCKNSEREWMCRARRVK